MVTVQSIVSLLFWLAILASFSAMLVFAQTSTINDPVMMNHINNEDNNNNNNSIPQTDRNQHSYRWQSILYARKMLSEYNRISSPAEYSFVIAAGKKRLENWKKNLFDLRSREMDKSFIEIAEFAVSLPWISLLTHDYTRDRFSAYYNSGLLLRLAYSSSDNNLTQRIGESPSRILNWLELIKEYWKNLIENIGEDHVDCLFRIPFRRNKFYSKNRSLSDESCAEILTGASAAILRQIETYCNLLINDVMHKFDRFDAAMNLESLSCARNRSFATFRLLFMNADDYSSDKAILMNQEESDHEYDLVSINGGSGSSSGSGKKFSARKSIFDNKKFSKPSIISGYAALLSASIVVGYLGYRSKTLQTMMRNYRFDDTLSNSSNEMLPKRNGSVFSIFGRANGGTYFVVIAALLILITIFALAIIFVYTDCLSLIFRNFKSTKANTTTNQANNNLHPMTPKDLEQIAQREAKHKFATFSVEKLSEPNTTTRITIAKSNDKFIDISDSQQQPLQPQQQQQQSKSQEDNSNKNHNQNISEKSDKIFDAPKSIRSTSINTKNVMKFSSDPSATFRESSSRTLMSISTCTHPGDLATDKSAISCASAPISSAKSSKTSSWVTPLGDVKSSN